MYKMVSLFNFSRWFVCICIIIYAPGFSLASSSPLLDAVASSPIIQAAETDRKIVEIPDSSEFKDEDISSSNSFAASPLENEYTGDSEERECPDGQWWHLRGQRCVPLLCIGGNKFRDVPTGECLIKKPIMNSWRFNHGFLRYTPRTIMKNNKGRIRFAMPTKVKG